MTHGAAPADAVPMAVVQSAATAAVDIFAPLPDGTAWSYCPGDTPSVTLMSFEPMFLGFTRSGTKQGKQ